MKKANNTTIVAVMLCFVSIWVVMATGITAVWLTEEVKVFGLVMLPTVVVAGLLVLYFDWRAKLLSRPVTSVTSTERQRKEKSCFTQNP